MELNEITGEIVDSSIKVHKSVGPGLLESVYEEILHYELTKRGIYVLRQVPLPFIYEKVKMEVGFRCDLIVKNKVIVEIKSVENVIPFFKRNYSIILE